MHHQYALEQKEEKEKKSDCDPAIQKCLLCCCFYYYYYPSPSSSAPAVAPIVPSMPSLSIGPNVAPPSLEALNITSSLPFSVLLVHEAKQELSPDTTTGAFDVSPLSLAVGL